jgi:hexosaminidase
MHDIGDVLGSLAISRVIHTHRKLGLGLGLALWLSGCQGPSAEPAHMHGSDTSHNSDPSNGDGDGDDDGKEHDDGDAGVPSARDASTGACAMTGPKRGIGDVMGTLSGLVPRPSSLEPHEGLFALSEDSVILLGDERARAPATLLRERLARGTGFELPMVSDSEASCVGDATVIALESDDSLTDDEAYTLEVESERITLRARTSLGFVRASQTLRQLFPAEIEREPSEVKARWLIPNLTIRDAPRFRYRGLHLDVSRHFWSVAFVKRYIDLLASYKLNVFHFHLTDDQGFRIEIKKYPRLTDVGAYRDDGTGKYGGFYTQDEIRDIVRYADARGVMVIPEIEMPGHASAALAAYPELGCTGQPVQVVTTWGIFDNLFCPTDDTFGVLEDVLREVFALFPAKYVHIGGDEVPKVQWQQSAAAQVVMAREGLKDEEELQAYFVRRIEAFARENGRTIIGWDEIVADGVPQSATIMAWRGIEEGKTAAEQGYDVIMTPNQSVYFDHYQADPAAEPKAIGGFSTVADVYAFDPLPSGISSAGATHVLGGQGNLWTEYITTEDYAEYMVMPRAIALAEVLWSARENRNYDDFVQRLTVHVPHLDALGVNYAKHALKADAQTPFGQVHAIPGTLQVEDYDQGGEGVSYRDDSAGNTPAKYRADDVDIEESVGGGFDVAYIADGEWLEYSVHVASAGSYTLALRSAAPQAGASLHLELDGKDVSGPVSVPATGDWTAFAVTSGPRLALPVGDHVLRVVFDKAGFNLDWLRFDAM